MTDSSRSPRGSKIRIEHTSSIRRGPCRTLPSQEIMSTQAKQLPHVGTASRISFAAGQVCFAYLPNLEAGSG